MITYIQFQTSKIEFIVLFTNWLAVKDLEMFMYGGGYGPTNEKLATYLHDLFPEVDKNRLLPEEVIKPQ